MTHYAYDPEPPDDAYQCDHDEDCEEPADWRHDRHAGDAQPLRVCATHRAEAEADAERAAQQRQRRQR